MPAFPGGHPTTRNLNYVWNTSTLVWDKMVQSSGGGSGTVTSVGLALPAEFTVSGSPVVAAGTLTAVWANVSANLVLAGPASGGATTPAFRSLVEADTTLADVTTNNVTSTKHGYAPKAPADATKFLNGAATPAYAQVKDSDLATTDITTNDVVSTKHGFAPKSPGDATKFLNGAATPAYAAVKDSDLATTDVTSNDVSTTKHGFASKRMVIATITLTDGATPALDASLGNVFRLAAAGNRTIAVPTNAVGGQKIIIEHFASGGGRTLALNTGAGGFRFGSDITSLTATASGKTDYIGCVYNDTDSFWDVVAVTKGF